MKKYRINDTREYIATDLFRVNDLSRIELFFTKNNNNNKKENYQ